MMCLTRRCSTANWIVDSAFRSECTTTLASLRCTNTSPGSRPVISLAGTRLSAQPIHMYRGLCCCARRVKKPGSRAFVCSAQVRLLLSRRCGIAASHRLGEQLAADQHAPDLRGAGADLVQLSVAPQAPERVLVDVAVAAEDLDALAGHPGRLLGAPEDDARAVLAHLAHMLAAQCIEVLADRVAVGARRLQHGVHVGHLALDQLELADA